MLLPTVNGELIWLKSVIQYLGIYINSHLNGNMYQLEPPVHFIAEGTPSHYIIREIYCMPSILRPLLCDVVVTFCKYN